MKSSSGMARWDAPAPRDVGDTVEEFLETLAQPSVLWFPGRDASRTRAFATLLHGNEHSGIRALHRWIKEAHQPAVNVLGFVGVVQAALTEPRLTNRCIAGWRDLNRCFRPPFSGPDGATALALLEVLRSMKPETLIDMHNTSGRSPAYGVTTMVGRRQECLTSLFSDHLVITDLRLGTLMEATEHDWPTVTIECGGANNHLSHEVAYQGLVRYTTLDSLDQSAPGVTVVHHPLRVEIRPGAILAYGTGPVDGADVSLPADVDLLNFGILSSQDTLGWIGSEGLEALFTRDAEGRDCSHEIFLNEKGILRLCRPSRIMMATTRLDIAKSDCLFYVLPVE